VKFLLVLYAGAMKEAFGVSTFSSRFEDISWAPSFFPSMDGVPQLPKHAVFQPQKILCM
jgi:hypothetical protein